MANSINFEGELNQISKKQLLLISSVLQKQCFGIDKATILPVGKPGDNYGANVKRITAEKDGQVFNMIAKVAQTNELIRQAVGMDKIYRNEYVMYTNVLPKLSELEDKAGIPETDKLRYPTCYGTFMEQPHEIILLEDLQVAGFEILDRFKSLTDNDVKLVLKEFAKLHTLSYVLKDREPEAFHQLKNNVSNILEGFLNPQMKAIFAQNEMAVMAMLDKEHHKAAVKGIVGNGPDLMMKLYKMDFDSRFSVIQQGDAWTNNIMFRLEDGQSVQCCMIDYQQSRVNSPVGDLLYMIFNCTDYETRKQFFYDWIDYYHSALGNRLSEFGLKVNFVYPRDQLDADLKRHGKVSLSQSVVMSGILLKQSTDAAKIMELFQNGDNMEELMKAVEVEAMDPETLMNLKMRVEGLINSHLEFGLA